MKPSSAKHRATLLPKKKTKSKNKNKKRDSRPGSEEQFSLVAGGGCVETKPHLSPACHPLVWSGYRVILLFSRIRESRKAMQKSWEVHRKDRRGFQGKKKRLHRGGTGKTPPSELEAQSLGWGLGE